MNDDLQLKTLFISNRNKPFVAEIRILFESSVTNTESLRKNFPLEIAKDTEGNFDGYRHDRTNDAWIGFAITMRCAERMTERASIPLSELFPLFELFKPRPDAGTETPHPGPLPIATQRGEGDGTKGKL